MAVTENKLTIFFILSALLHVAYIFGHNEKAVRITSNISNHPGISAQLALSNNSYNKNNPAKHRPTEHNSVRSDKSITSQAGDDPSDTEKNEASDKSATSAVYARIRGQLQNHFYYPQLARRQGWQGKVLVDFIVSETGRLQDIRIKRSSGYDILDHAAMNALREVVVADMAKETLLAAMRPGRMSVPVIYRLIN